jgi:hypothetical protein
VGQEGQCDKKHFSTRIVQSIYDRSVAFSPEMLAFTLGKGIADNKAEVSSIVVYG